jgi:hypothetical protein
MNGCFYCFFFEFLHAEISDDWRKWGAHSNSISLLKQLTVHTEIGGC